MSEDRDLYNSVENDEWTSVKDRASMVEYLQETAKKTLLKDQRMNIRISSRDLTQLKTRAMEEGIPYQTLVTSIIHKYLNGSLKESVS